MYLTFRIHFQMMVHILYSLPLSHYVKVIPMVKLKEKICIVLHICLLFMFYSKLSSK